MTTPTPAPILFVGAGPGDPELITVKGQKALQQADLIVYAGSLVPEAILKWAPADTERVNSASLHLDEIVAAMATAHHQGRKVVRLHTGDPSLYGAVFEQMAALSKQSIPYQVIPGVTAAFAAAAALGIEYTLPEVSQTLILTRVAGRTPVPQLEDLKALAAHQASMAIYLSISLVDKVQSALAEAYGPDGCCAIVYRASHPDQKIIATSIGQLSQTVAREKINRQALIVVGKTLAVKLDSLEHRSKLYDAGFAHGFRQANDRTTKNKDQV